MKSRLAQLRPDHWAWLHAKAALVVWAILFAIYTPDRVEATLGDILVFFVAAAVVIGILISVIGLFVSMSHVPKRADQGIGLELLGLWIAYAGPISYGVTQFFLVFTSQEGSDRAALVALAYSISSLILVRIVLVLKHRKRML